MTDKHWVTDFIDRAKRTPWDPPVPEGLVILTQPEIPTCGGVYFIQATAVENGPVKIGHTSNIRKRFSDLQVAHPWPLRLVGYILIEDNGLRMAKEIALHDRFHEFRTQGEWFSASVLEHVKVEK